MSLFLANFPNILKEGHSR